jgi:RHS repeat-associated protein
MESTGNVFSTAALPIEIREPIATIESQFAATKTDTPFTLPTLSAIASTSDIVPSLILSHFQALPFVEPMTGFAYARERFYDPRTGTFLTTDAVGYGVGSANLYAFGNGDPINHRDPSGLLCEVSNASGFWNWIERCSDDALSVRSENQKNYAPRNAGKNLKRAGGGVVSTAKIVGGAARTLLWDLPTASVNDAAADRLVAAGQSIGRFASHPIDATINAHREMVENVLFHEQRGEYVSSGEVAAVQAQTDFLVAYSAYALATAAYRAVPRGSAPIRWGPATDPGPLPQAVADTFRSGSYTQTVTAAETTLYRVYGGSAGELGSYWSRTPPGPLQATIDSALNPRWGNTAQNVSAIRVPSGTTIYEGFAAPQGELLGGGSQVYIPRVNPRWLIRP